MSHQQPQAAREGRSTSRSLEFRFETSDSGGFVAMLGDSSLGPNRIATQTAGSSNVGLYYQVGGAGLNGAFARQLAEARQLATVNAALVSAYDARYGAGSWKTWNAGGGSGNPPLTSFLIGLEPGVPPIGRNLTGMMYSVGPVLGSQGITDRSGYRDIYTDAMTDIARAGHQVDGLRITMLSTGIYATEVRDPTRLFVASAECIIEGVVSAVAADPRLVDVMILINTDDRQAVAGDDGKERYGFGEAARSRGVIVTRTGFDVAC